MKNSKEELIKTFQENPNLPVVFLVSNDDLCSDYGSTVMENYYTYVSEIYEYERFGDSIFSDDVDEVIEYYSDYFCDEDEYKDLSDEEYDKVIKEYVDQELVHYKAIVVSVSI